jgi:hypothetical protein
MAVIVALGWVVVVVVVIAAAVITISIIHYKSSFIELGQMRPVTDITKHNLSFVSETFQTSSSAQLIL